MSSPTSSATDPSEHPQEGQRVDPDISGPRHTPISKRRFLKLLAGGLAGAGASQLLEKPSPAEASYTPGSPSDVVDSSLTVQGSLTVSPSGQGSLTVGNTPQLGRLNVAGDIYVGGSKAIDASGVVARGKRCLYVQGEVVAPAPPTAVGTWGRMRTTTWGALLNSPATAWGHLSSTDGTWDRVRQLSWDQLSLSSWGHLRTL